MTKSIQSLFSLEGKVAIITGASRGIGEEIARMTTCGGDGEGWLNTEPTRPCKQRLEIKTVFIGSYGSNWGEKFSRHYTRKKQVVIISEQFKNRRYVRWN